MLDDADDEPQQEDAQKCSVLFTIDVKDQGIGIAKENIPNLFLAFSNQEDQIKMNPDGTGLGLSICKHMIE